MALTPCATDAEFLEKLKYLVARERYWYGKPDFGSQFGYGAVAAALHFGFDFDGGDETV